MELLIITGLSGAGKTRASDICEDLNYYCVDNLPEALLPQFAALCGAAHGRYEKAALVMDVRGLSNRSELDAVLKDAWEYAQAEQGSRYGFRKDFFVFHMYAHMAYHFLSGGCGIRSLLDIWIMEHRMDAAYPCAEKLLKKAGIYRFAVEMSRIANRCFTQHDSSDPVMAYIWRGGVYGSRKNRISVQKKRLGSSRAYIWKRLLLPYRAMTIRYPVLKRVPVLLPFCWVHRWVRAILRGKAGDFASELACTGRISDKDVQEVTEICMRLGLE